jgi:hypothetical protein
MKAYYHANIRIVTEILNKSALLAGRHWLRLNERHE